MSAAELLRALAERTADAPEPPGSGRYHYVRTSGLYLHSKTFLSRSGESTTTGSVEPSERKQWIAPDGSGRIFVAEQTGAVKVIKNGQILPTPFATLNVTSFGEHGLLGITFDPNFASNQYVYVYYTTGGTPFRNRLSRFTANGDVAAGGETHPRRQSDAPARFRGDSHGKDVVQLQCEPHDIETAAEICRGGGHTDAHLLGRRRCHSLLLRSEGNIGM